MLPCPTRTRLLPVPVACFASVFDLALTRVLPHQALLSPSLLTPTPPHTVTSGREREQEPWPRFGESEQGFRGSSELLYCGGLHFGPPFRPCTMMYEMYRPEMFIQPIKMEFPYLSVQSGQGNPFRYTGRGQGWRKGRRRALAHEACVDCCGARERDRVCPTDMAWAWDAPKKHRCGPGRPEALTFLETGMSSTLTKHYRNSLLLDKNRLFFPPVFM